VARLLAQARLRDHAGPQQSGAREVRAQEAPRIGTDLRGRLERDAQAIADESQQLRTGRGRHGGESHGSTGAEASVPRAAG
jgi:hypothetical protein